MYTLCRRLTLAALFLVASGCGEVAGLHHISRVQVASIPTALSVGQSVRITATAMDDANDPITQPCTPDYKVSNTVVGNVSTDGIFTAITPGTSTISVSMNGVVGTTAVTVVAARTQQSVTTVTVAPQSTTLSAGSSSPLTASVLDGNGAAMSGVSVTWSSDNTAIATVDASGEVTAVAPGTATIRATADGQIGTATVTVVSAPVGSILVTPGSVSIGTGASSQLSAVVLDPDGSVLPGRTVTWTSSTTSNATVSTTGTVTGVHAGTATVTASSGGKSSTAAVTVNAAGTGSMTLSTSNPSIGVGKTYRLLVTVRDADGNVVNSCTPTFTSNNHPVATVAADGTITGVSVGTAAITVKCGGLQGTATVTVTAASVATISVSPSAPALYVGQSSQMTATTKDANGTVLTGRAVTWSSANSAIAAISSTGTITGVTSGTTTITATSEGKSVSATVTVTNAPVISVSITPSILSLGVGSNATLTVISRDGLGNILGGRAATFVSSDPSIATVSANGTITGVAAGNATITVTVEGKTATVSVTVTAIPVFSLTVTPSLPALRLNESLQLNVTVFDALQTILTGRALTFTSDNTSIVSVSASGLITATGVGTAHITVSSEGKSVVVTVTVTAAPVATVAVSPSAPALLIDSTVQLSVTVRDLGLNILTGRTITYSSSNTAVATVSSTGLVKAIAAGTATITATSEGKTGTAVITVSAPTPPPPVLVTSIDLTPLHPTIIVGTNLPIIATPLDGLGALITGKVIVWASANTSVATVSASGVVTAVAPGTTTITASVDGVTATVTLTVTAVPVGSVSINLSTPTVCVGQTLGLSATVRDANNNILTNRPVVWTSSNPLLATVSATGVLSGIAVGGADITATVEGVSTTVHASICLPPVASITVSPSPITLLGLLTKQLSVTLRDAQGNILTGRQVTYSSSNGLLVKVSPSGLLSGLGLGTVTITVTSEGVSTTVAVSVL